MRTEFEAVITIFLLTPLYIYIIFISQINLINTYESKYHTHINEMHVCYENASLTLNGESRKPLNVPKSR